MTTSQARKKAARFIEQAKRDNDACLIVHFSRADDQYRGYPHGLDSFDALIIIQDLMKQYDLPPEAIALMRQEETTKN